ncbi:PREDICTED: ragulator complex protein LAMTOR1 [Lepidothrix coronata]|uniref:Ragulator complex protein LAMTOR1 n=1 Tax=Lepidothrix coronata TaxID=321398 RepID=A0A6J0IXY9_9PASS|nr:PREDICTED: ragulator complex protein LAMTOR1 [Lepidothrix coronata]
MGALAGKKAKELGKRSLAIASAEPRLCRVTLGCTGSPPGRWRVRCTSSLGVNSAGVGEPGLILLLPFPQEEETKRLLEPAASPPSKVLNGAEQSYHNLPSARTDEQAMLSSILAKTAINIIDVSAADSQGMEQHEYMDRARQYSTRLAMLSNNLTHWKKLPLLPSLTNQPHQVLASDPVPFADLQQVSRIAAYAFSALSQIRVDAKEELVVQFGIP